MKVKNTSGEERSFRVRLTLASTFYTGVSGKKVKGEVKEIKLKPAEGKMNLEISILSACLIMYVQF